MKRDFAYLFVVLAILLGFAMAFGCGDDDDDDDDDNDDDDDDDDNDDDNDDDDDDDDDDYIDGIPAGVFDFLDQDDLDGFEDGGMTIYPGENPPNIEGTFGLDSLVILYYSADHSIEGIGLIDGDITYSNQTDNARVDVDDSNMYQGDVSSGTGYISGTDDCYSAYLQVEGEQLGCTFTGVGVHSGCMRSGGIEDFYWGGIMVEKSGTNCDMLNEIDSVFIVYETDGLAAEM